MNFRLKPILPLLGVLLVIFCFVSYQKFYQKSEQKKSDTTIATEPHGADFTLSSSKGHTSLSDFKGKTVLFFFGFTRCPVVCPTTLSDLARLMRILSIDQQEKVQVLFISLDSERDSIDSAQTFANNFDKRFLALTGNNDELDAATKSYGAYYRKIALDSPLKYTIDHSSQIFVINPRGEWAGSIPFKTSAEEMKAKLIGSSWL